MKRTTHRTSKGTKLYAVRDKDGQFKDIQTYKRRHIVTNKPVNREMDLIDITLAIVRNEMERALTKHPTPFHSPHEGYAVILEELDELWDLVKANRGRDQEAFVEAAQVSATAARYIHDLMRSSMLLRG